MGLRITQRRWLLMMMVGLTLAVITLCCFGKVFVAFGENGSGPSLDKTQREEEILIMGDFNAHFSSEGRALSLVYSIRVRVYNIRVAPLRTMPLHDARCCAAPFASTRISSLR